MFKSIVVIGIAICLVQAAEAQSKKLTITPAAFAAYQAYIAALPKDGDGIFAVSEDGKRWGSFICPQGQHCDIGSMIVLAMAQCVDETQICEAIAKGSEPITPFEVAK